MNEVSNNAKAILLLTAPLIVSKKAEPSKTLTLKEYNTLARFLHSTGFQPQDLLGSKLEAILPKLPSSLERTRLESLLNRDFLLGQALSEWRKRSIWIACRADASYPKRLRTKLREHAPAILYGCGNRDILEKGGLAVVGSRNITEALKNYTENIGTLAAEAKVPIVSGAARGIDSSAMGGALVSGGMVIGVMADSLARAALAKANREALQEGRLVLISAYDPSAGFNVGHAMQRNKAIYALSDAALVVTSDFQKGGTWAGAIEQLDKFNYVPVFVRNGSEIAQGNVALIQRGGRPWPEPHNGEGLSQAISEARDAIAKEPRLESMELRLREEPIPSPAETSSVSEETAPEESRPDSSTPPRRLMVVVTSILVAELKEPKTDQEVAELLNVSKAQAKAWLAELAKIGKLEKVSKPVRYRTPGASYRLLP